MCLSKFPYSSIMESIEGIFFILFLRALRLLLQMQKKSDKINERNFGDKKKERL